MRRPLLVEHAQRCGDRGGIEMERENKVVASNVMVGGGRGGEVVDWCSRGWLLAVGERRWIEEAIATGRGTDSRLYCKLLQGVSLILGGHI